MTQREIDARVSELSAQFVAEQIALGRISKDSFNAMSASGLRAALTARESVAAPTEAERKAQESAARESDARTSHALSKPASQFDGNDREALRRAVTDWFRGNR